jgi:hypothetical protein
VAVPASESALPQAVREAVQKLTGEVVPESGPADACPQPPCAREAISAAKRWWEKEFEPTNGTIVGVVPAGPWDQFLHEKTPAREFPLVLRTRARNGVRAEYFTHVRFKKVEGDWYFDQASQRFLRNLPIQPDDPPADDALQKVLSDGFAAAHPGARVVKLLPAKYPDYDRDAHAWSYSLDVTYRAKDGKTQVCPHVEAKLEHAAAGKPWKYVHGRDVNCEEVLDQ